MFFLLLESWDPMPIEPPSSFEALQWVVVGMLTGALVYVFRQWQSEKKNCVEQDRETIDRLLEALRELLDGD